MQFVQPITWDDAVNAIGDRTPIGAALNSQEWSDVPVGLRDRAFFSATIEDVQFLQRARDFLEDFLANTTEQNDAGETMLKAGGRQQFVKDMSEWAVANGLGPLDAAAAGTLQDIRSESRLGLIFDTMTQSAEDFSYWKQGMDPDVLDAFPAQRFIREQDVKSPRPVHQANEGVVRLKSDLGFWLAMNDPSFGGFGVPYGPWGFNSGMGVDDVDRGEAEGMGLLEKNQPVRPVVQDFNEHLQASTKSLDPDLIAKLQEQFGDQVEFTDASVKWKAEGGRRNAEVGKEAPEQSAAVAAKQDNTVTLDSILTNLGLDGSQTATAEDMQSLRSELQEARPTPLERVVKYIKGTQPDGALTDERIGSVVQEFLSFLPRTLVQRLPALRLEVVRRGDFMGEHSPGGLVKLNTEYLQDDPARMRRTLFHELMHWVHREGPQVYQKAIQDHFEERTAGERVKNLPGYSGARGKTDKWYDAYAGKIYPSETTPGGLEVPTRYMEWLTLEPEDMARYWNDPDFRETMKIVLQGIF